MCLVWTINVFCENCVPRLKALKYKGNPKETKFIIIIIILLMIIVMRSRYVWQWAHLVSMQRTDLARTPQLPDGPFFSPNLHHDDDEANWIHLFQLFPSVHFQTSPQVDMIWLSFPYIMCRPCSTGVSLSPDAPLRPHSISDLPGQNQLRHFEAGVRVGSTPAGLHLSAKRLDSTKAWVSLAFAAVGLAQFLCRGSYRSIR